MAGISWRDPIWCAKTWISNFKCDGFIALTPVIATVSGAKKIGQPDKIDRSAGLVAQKGVISNEIVQDIGSTLNYF